MMIGVGTLMILYLLGGCIIGYPAYLLNKKGWSKAAIIWMGCSSVILIYGFMIV